MPGPDAWVPPDDVAFARGMALGVTMASLFWGGLILVWFGG